MLKCFHAVLVFTVVFGSPAFAADVKFSPLAAYTVVYQATGIHSGTVTDHFNRYGTEQVTINDLYYPSGRHDRTRIIALDDTVYSVDENTSRIGWLKNSTYQRLVELSAGKDGERLVDSTLTFLGFDPQGTAESYLGQPCRVWSNFVIKQSRCVTADGIVLRVTTDTNIGPAVRIAREVRRGDPGPESAYRLPPGAPMQRVDRVRDMPGLHR